MPIIAKVIGKHSLLDIPGATYVHTSTTPPAILYNILILKSDIPLNDQKDKYTENVSQEYLLQHWELLSKEQGLLYSLYF